MLTLSIQQPWAWLITSPPAGIRKDIENRSWRTDVRGPILIHAGKKVDWDAYSWVQTALKIVIPRDLPTGGIVGTTTIVDCVEESNSRWFFGDWGFVLKNSRELPFQACPGKLGFFDVKYDGVV